MGDASKLQISDDGWVMWEISGVQDYTLYLYKGGDPAGNTIQLTSKIYYLSPGRQFGASGQVVWIERDTGYREQISLSISEWHHYPNIGCRFHLQRL